MSVLSFFVCLMERSINVLCSVVMFCVVLWCVCNACCVVVSVVCVNVCCFVCLWILLYERESLGLGEYAQIVEGPGAGSTNNDLKVSWYSWKYFIQLF